MKRILKFIQVLPVFILFIQPVFSQNAYLFSNVNKVFQQDKQPSQSLEITFEPNYEREEYTDFNYAKYRLIKIHSALMNIAESPEELVKLREEINREKSAVAPHFPVRNQDENLSGEERQKIDNEAMTHWISNYPDEVEAYVNLVNEKINEVIYDRLNK